MDGDEDIVECPICMCDSPEYDMYRCEDCDDLVCDMCVTGCDECGQTICTDCADDNHKDGGCSD